MGETKKGYRLVLKQKQYCKLILSNMINRFGDSIDSIAFTWLIYAITNNATWSAIIFGINKIPTIFLQPIAGAIVEKRNKKSIMILTNIIRGICVGFVAIAYYSDFLQPWMLIITTLIISSVEAFCLPASSSVVLNILDKDNFEFGISLNSSVSNVIELIGLGAAGVIIANFGITSAIVIDAVTFFGSALIIAMINTNEKKYEVTKINIIGYVKLLKEGTQYVRTKKIVLNLIVLAILANAMFVPFNSLQAPLTKEVLRSGEGMLSILSISMSIGMLLSTIIFPYVIQKISGKAIIALGGSSIGIFYVLLVLIGRYLNNSVLLLYGSVAIITFIAGLFVTFLSLYVNVSFMKSVEREYIARTAAIMNSAGASSTPIVSFIISIIVAFISTKTIFFTCGIVLVIVMILIALKMNFDDNKETINDETMIDGRKVTYKENAISEENKIEITAGGNTIEAVEIE